MLEYKKNVDCCPKANINFSTLSVQDHIRRGGKTDFVELPPIDLIIKESYLNHEDRIERKSIKNVFKRTRKKMEPKPFQDRVKETAHQNCFGLCR